MHGVINENLERTNYGYEKDDQTHAVSDAFAVFQLIIIQHLSIWRWESKSTEVLPEDMQAMVAQRRTRREEVFAILFDSSPDLKGQRNAHQIDRGND